MGAQERVNRGGAPLAETVVLKLSEPIAGLGYNICCDNFFTSLPLAKKLLQHQTTLTGTMRKNRRELSAAMTDPKRNQTHTSEFFFNREGQALFVKYQPKPAKSVCLLSAMHRHPDVDQTTTKKKPELILFYNKNKTAVDTFDQMSRLYSTRCASFRWPLSVWANMLDIAVINSLTIYRESCNKTISRRNFILELVTNLRQRYVQQRENRPPLNLPKTSIKCFFKKVCFQ